MDIRGFFQQKNSGQRREEGDGEENKDGIKKAKDPDGSREIKEERTHQTVAVSHEAAVGTTTTEKDLLQEPAGNDLGTPESGPRQTLLPQYPRSQFGSQQRSFNKSWFEQFKWLEYSVLRKSAFCFSCRVFGKQNTTKKGSLSHSGFSNWKKALDTFREHEKSSSHSSSMICWNSFKTTRKQDVGQLGSASAAEISDRRQYLHRIFDVTIFLAKQGIPFLGHDEEESTSHSQGNFLECMKLLKKYDPFLKNYKPASHTTYQSHFSQNEMITCISNEVTESIVKEIREAKVYSVMADEARDGLTQQLAVCVRFVSREGHVKERFLGSRKLERFDAQSITAAIEELLQYYTLDDLLCVAQSYDGASVVSGAVGGVQARFRQQHPEAVYVHCYAHELNLVLCNTCKAFPAASDFFGLLEDVYTFFNTSLLNHTKFKELQKDLGLVPSELIQLSNTRWACQVNSVKALLDNISAVLATLEATDTPMAKGILSKLSNPKTVYMLIMFSELLGITEGLHCYLQGERIDMGKAVEYKMYVVAALTKLRTETAAEEIFEKAMDICRSCNIQTSQRSRHKRKRLEEFVVESSCGATPTPLTSSAEFRRDIFFPCLDRMLKELADRFSGEGQKIMEGIQACNPSSPIFLSEDALKPIAVHYHVTIKPQELLVAREYFERKMETEDIRDITTVFHLLDEVMFPTLKAILRVALTIPVSSCSCERSFSALRRLHTWLRSTMGQKKSNDLAILSVEKDFLNRIDPEEVIDRFAKLKPRRYNLMLP